jgi:hypothetical protein
MRVASATLDVTPDGRRRLSEGGLVEASVVARLLGMRLLRLHATIALAPAEVRPASAGARARASPEATPIARRAPSGAPGRSLRDAIVTIDEAGEVLAEIRRNSAAGVAVRRHADGRAAARAD